ncbi:MAG: ATP-dependent helicase [Candidatus Nealsonbacteria bacterium]
MITIKDLEQKKQEIIQKNLEKVKDNKNHDPRLESAREYLDYCKEHYVELDPKAKKIFDSIVNSMIAEAKKTTNDILDKIVQTKKPLLILAGPGSGKTYTIAYKLKYLVEVEKVDPDEISVITFTNEAAMNMRKKISSKSDEEVYISQELQPSNICTMNKLGNRIIKDNCSKIAGLDRNFKVLSSTPLKNMIMEDCSQILGHNRQEAKDTILCRRQGECNKKKDFKCELCSEYIKLLKKFNYIDYDEQILLACELLRKDKGILIKEQEKTKYLLVDEYQDINHAQWELIKLLSQGNTENLFVVGDNYQSIYGFRGGKPKYIQNFKKDYAPNAVVLNLNTNYRCPPNIFKGAFHMVQKYNGGDIGLLDKIDFKEQSEVLIKIHQSGHANLEAYFIAERIKEIGHSYSSLILIPTSAYAVPIKRELRKKFIRFSCDYKIEETDLYLINLLLKWLKDSSDNFNFRLLLGEIIKKESISGISAKKREIALKQISNFWGEIEKGKTLYQKLKTLKKEKLFEKLIEIFVFFKKIHKEEASMPFISSLVEKLKIWQKASPTHPFLKEINSIIEEAESLTTPFISLLIEKLKIWQSTYLFSKEINSVIEEVEDLAMPGECNVRIITMKKAKGLQADHVFIVGLENNILPHQNSKIDEESRLFYVSMTRTKKELYLLHSDVRERKITKIKIGGKSKFIDAIPKQYLVCV